MKAKTKKGFKKFISVILIILITFCIGDLISASWHSNPDNIIKYESENRYINQTGSPYVSAHRSGGGIEPEESMLAFKNCIENPNFNVDVFEFDLHITKDNVLVLLHDDTLERTTDCEKVLGDAEARPENYTYDQLRKLNIGAKFENEAGEMPYANVGEDFSDDLKIVRVEDILDYLMQNGNFDYIIEIKNGGDLGKKGVDILYPILKDRNLLDKTIFGTFKEEVSFYVDDNYPDLKRSATIKEVLSFYFSALLDKKDFEAKYIALQVPYNMPLRLVGNLATAQVINYAHKHNIALQYWTINKESELEYLSTVGADCIMSDYPDKLYNTIHKDNK